MRRAQLSFGDGLITEEVSDLREDWMTYADQVLADEQIVSAVYEALAKRHPKSRGRGRPGAPAEVVHVMKQARVRIFRGDTRSKGKILSLFEPSTEIICKGKAGKPNEFGKMVKLQEAENQIVIDYEVYAQRPHDSELLIAAIETHQSMLGRASRIVAADAAFYSAKR